MNKITPFGTTTGVTHTNRTLALRKTRNGNGGGLKLAFDFGRQNLGSKELGVVVKNKRDGSDREEMLLVS